eukprot:756622-Hanusia_phi.AAC.1
MIIAIESFKQIFTAVDRTLKRKLLFSQQIAGFARFGAVAGCAMLVGSAAGPGTVAAGAVLKGSGEGV